MKTLSRQLVVPVILVLLIAGFWASDEFREIAAGVAIFLFGMLMLEDGFKLFAGGFLERILERMTNSVTRSLLFGIVSTTIMQSSSLVSVITISFLSAGLITLTAGVAIIFGANIGTTTGAWLVAGFGLKVNISAYAMPLIALGVVMVFKEWRQWRGTGYVLAGLGFLFLGIHHMKQGFEAFQGAFDLRQFAMTGLAGLGVYTLLGAAATVVMQSSHATMVLVITALAAGQVSYDNALALAIGANIGTTVTAILGSLTANYKGRQLAAAHLIFNVLTAAVALVFIAPLREAVDWVSLQAGIADNDFALKLAVFHTIFNVLGVILLLPLLGKLIAFIERVLVEPEPDLTQPLYLSKAVDAFPATIESALYLEVHHLYQNASGLIIRALNLDQGELLEARDIEALVARRRWIAELDIEDEYESRVKSLYSAIIAFTTRAGAQSLPDAVTQRVYQLRDISERLVRAVKDVKHLRKNLNRYTSRPQGEVTRLYNELRAGIARILVEIHRLDAEAPEDRSRLWLDAERYEIEDAVKETNLRVERLLRDNRISPQVATSFLNDSAYAYSAMRALIDAASNYYVEKDAGLAEVEAILGLDADEIDTLVLDKTGKLAQSAGTGTADARGAGDGATGQKDG